MSNSPATAMRRQPRQTRRICAEPTHLFPQSPGKARQLGGVTDSDSRQAAVLARAYDTASEKRGGGEWCNHNHTKTTPPSTTLPRRLRRQRLHPLLGLSHRMPHVPAPPPADVNVPADHIVITTVIAIKISIPRNPRPQHQDLPKHVLPPGGRHENVRPCVDILPTQDRT